MVASSTNELLQTIEELIGGGAVQLFHHLVSRVRGNGGTETVRLDVPSGAIVNFERGYIQRRPQGVVASVRVERPSRSAEGRSEGRDFDPLLTLQRWAEEIKILHGDFVTERASKLTDHVILSLLPAAVEEAKEAKIREEQELVIRRAKEEAAAKIKEEERVAKLEADEKARREAEEATRMESELSAPGPSIAETEMAVADVDTEMADASGQVTSPPVTEGETAHVPAGDGENVAVNEPDQPSSGQAESSRATDRITVIIHGSPVDITDTGIDPTFLEALPDDMREEVLNQHVREQRASRVEHPPDSQISPEFLDALPPEIRAEIIQQERLDQLRRQAEDGSGDPPTGVPAEIDPASFIASLDPQLRQVVLLDQDDGFIQTLPSHIIAEVEGYQDGSQHPRRPIVPRPAASRPVIPRKVPPPHDAIQLLDKAGVAVLVRLLFFPQVLRKNLLFKVLMNLCENAKTRTELFNLLLNILQDGTGDLAAVDKSFAQMSFRNSKPSSQQMPKTASRQKLGSDYLNALPLPILQNEAVPDLIAQRCLESLTFIVSSNELSSLFFLTEHELPAGLRRAVSKKGKGKEKQTPQTHYPIVLLLGLLDRQSLLKTPSIMESVVSLLATVTRPLASIKDGSTKAEEVTTSPTQPNQQRSSTPSAPDLTPPAPEATPASQQDEVPGKVFLPSHS